MLSRNWMCVSRVLPAWCPADERTVQGVRVEMKGMLSGLEKWIVPREDVTFGIVHDNYSTEPVCFRRCGRGQRADGEG